MDNNTRLRYIGALDSLIDPNLPPDSTQQSLDYQNIRREYMVNKKAAGVEPDTWDTLKESWRVPLGPMGETARLFGWEDTADFLEKAGTPKPGYGQAAGDFVEALKSGGLSEMGEEFLPAVAEQGGQVVGSVGSRFGGAGAGAAAGAAIGSIVPGAGTAAGAALGAIIGAFAGPFMFEALQIIGPTSYSLAKQRGKEEPDWDDISQALVTSAASGALNAAGANLLPGGTLAVRGTVNNFLGNVTKKAATGVMGEGLTEGAQGFVQQAGETAFTPKGFRLDPTAALGEALIGGGAGGAVSTVGGIAQEAADPMREADSQYIRDALTAEAQRKGFVGPDSVQFADLGSVEEVDPDTGETLMSGQEAVIEEGSGRVVFDDVFIEKVLNAPSEDGSQRKPATRKEAKEAARQLLQHEGTAHGGMFAWFNSAPSDSGIRSSVNSLEDYLTKFDQTNPEFVNSFLNTGRGQLYANKDRNTQIKEAIAIEIAEGNKSGIIRGIISKVKLLLKRATGFDFSEAEIRDVLRSIDLDLRTGRLQQATPDVAIDEGAVLASERGPQDPSRRRFLQQTAGAVAGAAVDPSILLEPATPTPPVSPPGFGGGIMGPGVAPEMESVLRAAAADAAPTTGLVSDVASRAFDDYDAPGAFEADQEAARQEREDIQRRLDELEAREDEKKVPQKWRELETPELQTLMEANRAKDNPIWVAQNKELESRGAAEQEADTDSELYIDTVDEIMSVYDADAPASEAARDGTLNDRIISYAVETPFTREELWEGVNQRIEAVEDPLASAKRIRKPKSETLQRDINDGAKKARQRINKLTIEEDEKATRVQLLKRLQNIMGAPARKRGIDAGDQDVFIEQAAKIVDGNLTEVEEFIAPFEAGRTAPKEKVYRADARRAQRARKIGKTDAEILKYRPKGARHPMEGKMTYPFAQEEIDRQEQAGEITPQEAEIRRLAVNNVRRIYTGKAGPTVKRTLSEAVYGIGNYEDLVPWSDVYTEEQTKEMGERAEIGQAEARRTRYDPTDLTDKERTDLLEAAETAEEKSILDAAEANPPYPDVDKFDSNQDPVFNAFQKTMLGLDTRAERLTFLRAPTEFKSEAEQKEFEAWRDNQKGFVAEDYKAEERAKRDKLVAEAMQEGKVTRIPAEAIEKIKETQRTVTNYVPSAFERLRMPDYYEGSMGDFEIAGREYTEQGELINDAEMQIVETEGTEPLASAKVIKKGDIVTKSGRKLFLTVGKVNEEEGTVDVVGRHKERGGVLFGVDGKAKWTIPLSQIELTTVREVATGRALRKAVFNDSYAIINTQDASVVSIEKDALKALGAENPYGKRYQARIMDALESENAGGVKSWEIDHVIAIDAGGMNFALNLMPLPDWANRLLSNKALSDVLDSNTEDAKAFQKAMDYMKNKDNWKDSSEMQIIARAFDFAKGITPKSYESLAGIDLPDGGIVLRNELFKGKTGLELRIALYENSASAFTGGAVERGGTWDIGGRELASAKKINTKNKDYTEHFNDSFWYKLTSFLWGKPVQAIRDFNKSKRFGSQMGDIKAASKIADLIQRAQTVTKRTEGLEYGTDMMQDVSMRSGEFFSQLARIFATVTDRPGDIPADINKQLVDHLVGRSVKFSSPEIEAAAKELDALVKKVYKYGRDETSSLKERLNLRGEGDTTLPRVWNIEYLATRRGKAEFLKVIHSVFSDPKKRGLIFADAGITADDIYNTVINSGGFVQGDWTNVKADQTRSSADVAKDERIQEILDSLPTEAMIDEGLVLDDVQAIIPRFIQKAIERTEYSKRFGINDELLRGMIQEGVTEIRENNRKVLRMDEAAEGLSHIDEKAFERSVWDMSRILRNQYGYDMANMSTRKWLQRATNTMTMMKLPLVTLASIPEFFTPMLKGDVRPDKWFVDFMAGTTWAGYKAANGMSKLLFNKHLPAMRKAADDIKGIGVIRDVQILRELGIADIQAMGDLVATRYANPNFARGGLRAGAKGTIAEKVPKKVRAAFNMQTYMQGTLLTTITEMQQLMAYRNFQRHIGRRLQFLQKHKGKKLTARRAKLFKQFRQDLADYGITTEINLDTAAGQAEFNAGALRFVDQVITRPNDATTAKAFKNPLISPLVLFKRFITTYGNTLMTALGNDFATKVDNKERAKMLAKVTSVAMVMYGSVMFAEVLRGAIKGDLDEEDFDFIPDWNTFVRRLERTGLGGPIGAIVTNLGFPYKRGWWDTTQSRIMNELLGPIGGTLSDVGDTILSDKDGKWMRLVGQLVPTAKPLLPDTKKRGKSGVRREVY